MCCVRRFATPGAIPRTVCNEGLSRVIRALSNAELDGVQQQPNVPLQF